MRLKEALGVSSGDVVAFVGAGGKSSAILALATELKETGLRVLALPTTKMFQSEADRIGATVTAGDPEALRNAVERAFASNRSVVAGGGLLSKKRIAGVAPAQVPDLARLADVTLVEADGARRRLIKGTADHEPALPAGVSLVVAVGNIEAFGKPVSEDHVHRPELFSRLTGVGPGQSITARAFARALQKGSLQNIPETARAAALITGVEPGPRMADASVVARELWRSGIKRVVFASLDPDRPARVWIP
ncbi:MAG: selenium cofactor biosynthesis protein YqeC [Actinomycetota bacterium]